MKKSIFSIFFIAIVLQLFTSCGKTNDNLITNISFYHDAANTLTIDKVNNTAFKDITTNRLDVNQGYYWFLIELNEEAHQKDIGIKIAEAYVKNLELFNADKEKIASFLNPKQARFYIPINKPSSKIYAKIAFSRNPFLIVEGYTQKELIQIEKKDTLENSAYYIIVLFFFVLVISLGYFFKNTIFFWYALFQFSVNLCIALFDNTLAGLISSEKVLNHILGINLLMIPIFTVLYVIKPLKVEKYYPKAAKGLYILFIPLVILNVIFHFTENFSILAYQDLFSSLFYIVIFILSILLIKKVPFAKYFLVGYTILFTTGILYSININFGYRFIPFDITTLKIGVIIEIIVLTYATILKAKEVLHENEQRKQLLISRNEQLKTLEKLKITNYSFSQETINQFSEGFDFSKREKEVYQLLAKGKTNKEISDELFISIATVKFHAKNIYIKTAVKNKAELLSKITGFNS